MNQALQLQVKGQRPWEATLCVVTGGAIGCRVHAAPINFVMQYNKLSLARAPSSGAECKLKCKVPSL